MSLSSCDGVEGSALKTTLAHSSACPPEPQAKDPRLLISVNRTLVLPESNNRTDTQILRLRPLARTLLRMTALKLVFDAWKYFAH